MFRVVGARRLGRRRPNGLGLCVLHGVVLTRGGEEASLFYSLADLAELADLNRPRFREDRPLPPSLLLVLTHTRSRAFRANPQTYLEIAVISPNPERIKSLFRHDAPRRWDTGARIRQLVRSQARRQCAKTAGSNIRQRAQSRTHRSGNGRNPRLSSSSSRSARVDHSTPFSRMRFFRLRGEPVVREDPGTPADDLRAQHGHGRARYEMRRLIHKAWVAKAFMRVVQS